MGGKKLKALRELHGLTQKELGEIIGISDTPIRLIETGYRKGSKKVLNALAEYLNVDIEELKDDEDLNIFFEMIEFIDIVISHKKINSIEEMDKIDKIKIMEFLNRIILIRINKKE